MATVNPDGSPQVTVIWVGLAGDQLVSGHTHLHKKLRNMQRDPRVVLSFTGPRDRDVLLNPYAILPAVATVEPSDDAWPLLDRLARVYMRPDAVFPGTPEPGYIVRYDIQRVGGVGPWAAPR